MSLLTSKAYHSFPIIINDLDSNINIFELKYGIGTKFAKEPGDKIQNLIVTYDQPMFIIFNKLGNDVIPLRHNAPGTWARLEFDELLDPTNFNIKDIFLTNLSGATGTIDFLILPRHDGTVYE